MKVQRKILLTICAISMTYTISYAQFHTVSMEKTFYKVEFATASEKVETNNRREYEQSTEPFMSEQPAKASTPESMFCLPLDTLVVTSPYGYRIDPFTSKWKMHRGIDFRASSDNVYAMMLGKVVKVGYDKVPGKFVTIQHGNITVSYCHLSEILVKKNTIVEAGHVVGITGNTGRSNREYLHLTCKCKDDIINPQILLKFIK